MKLVSTFTALVGALVYADCILSDKIDARGICVKPTDVPVSPDLNQIRKDQETAKTAHYKGVQYVPGKAFDRIVITFLENTDYDKAIGQEGIKKLASQGITLTNYWGLVHPSQPNYIASVGGDTFGVASDDFKVLPDNVFSVVDLLETKGISWAEYQEESPYSGFQGFNYSNQETMANNYVRKHNPLISFSTVSDSEERLSNIKNFTEFDRDLANSALPQWSFITPNMTNDGHDTSIKVSGNWAWNFFSKHLNNDYFTKRTLIVVTFDENEIWVLKNRVAAVLIGDIPESLKGTADDTYYDHYSLLSTVQNNWELPNLGRKDCGANVFQVVADKTGYKNKDEDTTFKFNNLFDIGHMSCTNIPLKEPDLTCQGAGGPVLDRVIDAWR